jgi:hypothetical protein
MRLRCACGSASPYSSKRKAVIESTDEDLDNDLDAANQDIANLWDDEQGGFGQYPLTLMMTPAKSLCAPIHCLHSITTLYRHW